jgi:aspartate/methionine/tyrosine aminotransferase
VIGRTVLVKKQVGTDMISLGVGDPGLPPPRFILDALKDEVAAPNSHGY